MPESDTLKEKHLEKDFNAIINEAKRIANQKSKNKTSKKNQEHLSKAKGGGDIGHQARIPEENVSSILEKSAVNQDQTDQGEEKGEEDEKQDQTDQGEEKGEENREEDEKQQQSSQGENQQDKVPPGGESDKEQEFKNQKKQAQKAKKTKKAMDAKAKIDKAKKIKKNVKKLRIIWTIIVFIFTTWWIWLALLVIVVIIGLWYYFKDQDIVTQMDMLFNLLKPVLSLLTI